ncbi:MAG: hypothetical protein JSW67_12595 [Candidatus Latescibacterota bacterium]|nr:MAG: hypothetical protein JSW67_12595 [Candidatus Latescibacterota bacterium]
MGRSTIRRVLLAMILVAVVYLAMYARHGIVQRQDRVHATHVQVAGAVTELRAVCERLLFAVDLTGTKPGAERARLEARLDIARRLLPQPRLLPPATPEPGAAFRQLEEPPLPDVVQLCALADSLRTAAMEFVAAIQPPAVDSVRGDAGLRTPVRERYATVVARSTQYRAMQRELDEHLNNPFVGAVASIFRLRSRPPPHAAPTSVSRGEE